MNGAETHDLLRHVADMGATSVAFVCVAWVVVVVAKKVF